MEVIVSGRHIELDDDIRAYAREKIERLSADFPKLTTARVVVELERSWRVVEIHLHGKHLALDAKAKSQDVQLSVDAAVEKLAKQLRRHVERLREHRANSRHPEGEVEPDVTEEDEEQEEV